MLTLQKPHIPVSFNPLNAELNPICHFLSLLGGATIVVVSRLRVNIYLVINKCVTAAILSNFSRHYLRNRSTLGIGVLGHIGVF
jgi:hypothetical protein